MQILELRVQQELYFRFLIMPLAVFQRKKEISYCI